MNTTQKNSNMIVNVLSFLFYPTGVYRVWKKDFHPRWVSWMYTILGLPLFLLVYAFIGLVLFAAFLPELDRTIGERPDRTIVNSTDDYTVTFLKTNKETNGAYEEVQVELLPGGGNEWHYHTAFVEKFHVVQGELTVGVEGKPVKIVTGNDYEVPKGVMHKFYNASTEPVTFLVKIDPARSFEKTLRSAYGLMNTGQSTAEGMPKNPWHLFLILGYSDSYLQGVPGLIQEPLIDALSKIAQWKGYDKDFDPFCR